MAKRTKHSDGPWRFAPSSRGTSGRVFQVNLPKRLIATVHVGEIATAEQVKADANLIAAAPELYAELEALLEWVERVALPAMDDVDTDGGNSYAASARRA